MLGSVADVAGAFEQFAAGVRVALGLTRHGRLRAQLRETLDLREKAVAQIGLDNAIATLAKVIELQTTELLAVTNLATRRTPEWGAFWVGLFFTALAAFLGWLLGVRLLDRWWGWVLVVVFELGALIFFIATVQSLFKRTSAAPPDDTTSA